MPVFREPVILCVDDDHSILALYYARFSLDGYRCVPCESLGAATAMVHVVPVALAVLDYDVPGTNGVEIARCLRAIRPSIPLVLNSSNLAVCKEDINIFDAVHTKGHP